mmetsp:Transcript_44779/g.88055  ORF Transcript_44779/g.88055 Transcript_44779/m.88055 type:complete len:127 (+) Transcript_44779:615-995(+)
MAGSRKIAFTTSIPRRKCNLGIESADAHPSMIPNHCSNSNLPIRQTRTRLKLGKKPVGSKAKYVPRLLTAQARLGHDDAHLSVRTCLRLRIDAKRDRDRTHDDAAPLTKNRRELHLCYASVSQINV